MITKLNEKEIENVTGGEVKSIGTCGYKGHTSIFEVWEYTLNTILTTWGLGGSGQSPKPDPWA